MQLQKNGNPIATKVRNIIVSDGKWKEVTSAMRWLGKIEAVCAASSWTDLDPMLRFRLPASRRRKEAKAHERSPEESEVWWGKYSCEEGRGIKCRGTVVEVTWQVPLIGTLIWTPQVPPITPLTPPPMHHQLHSPMSQNLRPLHHLGVPEQVIDYLSVDRLFCSGILNTFW